MHINYCQSFIDIIISFALSLCRVVACEMVYWREVCKNLMFLNAVENSGWMLTLIEPLGRHKLRLKFDM